MSIQGSNTLWGLLPNTDKNGNTVIYKGTDGNHYASDWFGDTRLEDVYQNSNGTPNAWKAGQHLDWYNQSLNGSISLQNLEQQFPEYYNGTQIAINNAIQDLQNDWKNLTDWVGSIPGYLPDAPKPPEIDLSNPDQLKDLSDSVNDQTAPPPGSTPAPNPIQDFLDDKLQQKGKQYPLLGIPPAVRMEAQLNALGLISPSVSPLLAEADRYLGLAQYYSVPSSPTIHPPSAHSPINTEANRWTELATKYFKAPPSVPINAPTGHSINDPDLTQGQNAEANRYTGLAKAYGKTPSNPTAHNNHGSGNGNNNNDDDHHDYNPNNTGHSINNPNLTRGQNAEANRMTELAKSFGKKPTETKNENGLTQGQQAESDRYTAMAAAHNSNNNNHHNNDDDDDNDHGGGGNSNNSGGGGGGSPSPASNKPSGSSGGNNNSGGGGGNNNSGGGGGSSSSSSSGGTHFERRH